MGEESPGERRLGKRSHSNLVGRDAANCLLTAVHASISNVRVCVCVCSCSCVHACMYDTKVANIINEVADEQIWSSDIVYNYITG